MPSGLTTRYEVQKSLWGRFRPFFYNPRKKYNCHFARSRGFDFNCKDGRSLKLPGQDGPTLQLPGQEGPTLKLPGQDGPTLKLLGQDGPNLQLPGQHGPKLTTTASRQTNLTYNY